MGGNSRRGLGASVVHRGRRTPPFRMDYGMSCENAIRRTDTADRRCAGGHSDLGPLLAPRRGGHAHGQELSPTPPSPTGSRRNRRGVETGQSAPRRRPGWRASKTGQSAPRRRRRHRYVQSTQKQHRKGPTEQGRVKVQSPSGRSTFGQSITGRKTSTMTFQTTHFPGRF